MKQKSFTKKGPGRQPYDRTGRGEVNGVSRPDEVELVGNKLARRAKRRRLTLR